MISNLKDTKYIITIDVDTQLIMDTAKKLIGVISHPLNRAVIDEKKGIVVAGYGLIQPKIGKEMDSANKTVYSKVFAGEGGIDSYTTAYSDVYQDLFGEGIFTGKGIYDLRVFSRVLKGVIPDNTVLSHDLLEGIHVGVGLASDIELIDSFPGKYLSFMARLHRWTRGDWQLVKWLYSDKRNTITSISKWKIADNLRRSVVPISQFLFFIFGIIFAVNNTSLWFLFGAFSVLFRHLLALADNCLKESEIFNNRQNDNLFNCFKIFFALSALTMIFLPYKAYIMADAIVRTLFRMYVTKTNLLEWVTAADIDNKSDGSLYSYVKIVHSTTWISVGLLIFTIILRHNYIIYAIVLSTLWSTAPLWAYWISKNKIVKKEKLNVEDIDVLRQIAKNTWATMRIL
ncbi:MAG: hypothetical protein LR001_08390 [Clostridiales bacterium]|nr:hypothetical protein [Clostridiales bacterium]